MKSLTEERLKQTDAGKDFLYGQDAQKVARQVHQEDTDARKKTADVKRDSNMEAQLEENRM